jgi:hypothetical protein
LYLKVVRGFPRPQPAVPKAFSQIDAKMKACCDGSRTETIAPGMPAGVIEVGEEPVESQPLDVHLPDTVYRCLIRGTTGPIVRLDGGGYLALDIKTADQGSEEFARAARQLHAYAYALEHPAGGGFTRAPITRLGLLVFEPETFARGTDGGGALTGGLSWIEIPRDDGRLFGFLAEVLSVLEQPEPLPRRQPPYGPLSASRRHPVCNTLHAASVSRWQPRCTAKGHEKPTALQSVAGCERSCDPERLRLPRACRRSCRERPHRGGGCPAGE